MYTYTYKSFNNLDDFVHTMWESAMTDLTFKNLGKYPPYDILKEKVDNTTYYVLNMALAGFKKDDIEVIQIKDQLIIRPTTERVENGRPDSQRTYLHNGISHKEFQRTFVLDKTLTVETITFIDGILSVRMRVDTPESDTPKRLEIG